MSRACYPRQMNYPYRIPCAFLFYTFLLFVLTIPSGYCFGTDTLTRSQHLTAKQTLISSGQIFELGFFNPGNSSKQYVGLWYRNISIRKVVWVLNRENPLLASDIRVSLAIGEDGNLVLLDGNRNIVWSTNVSVKSNSSIAMLSDKGDFILKDNISGLTLWESFNYPSDTFFPGMMLGRNVKTGDKRLLSCWQANDNPSLGNFVAGLSLDTPPQAFVWNGSKPYWRGGPWNQWKFVGTPDSDGGYANGFNVQSDNQQGSAYLTLDTYNGDVELKGMKLPDHFEYLYMEDDRSGCRQWCMNNCSCVAYAFADGIGCMVWAGDLMDVQQFSINGEVFFLRLAYSELGDDKTKHELIISFLGISGVILLGFILFCWLRKTRNQRVTPTSLPSEYNSHHFLTTYCCLKINYSCGLATIYKKSNKLFLFDVQMINIRKEKRSTKEHCFG
ncbi:unnamed protein product [Thlaspi arvense]|uniref:Uncharacterized protein n=1 Tax=Thlaspi arvense TaxID=13288 RepID=A0AAU9RGY2_THLAR|nr:unnamed protein product [Thlaspi arvense]